MPEDCIFLLSLDLGGGGGANRVGVIPFCTIEIEELHKILRSFLKGHLFFFAFQFPSYKKETTKEESITRQILGFFFYQNDGIPNQHNMALAVISPLKNKLVLLSITQ